MSKRISTIDMSRIDEGWWFFSLLLVQFDSQIPLDSALEDYVRLI